MDNNATETTARQRPNYGIDAPGVVAGMFLMGATALALTFCIGVFPRQSYIFFGIVRRTAEVYAVLFIGMACYMIYWSKIGKIRGRENLLDLVPWSGGETILDVGCGRGLLLLAAAKRTSAGRAIGIDIWQAKDQSGNCAKATLANAMIEGVQDRVEILTADMTNLPFPDQSFDLVVSHWAVHNLNASQDRARALAEMARVLKPGGRVLLADIQFRVEYASQLTALGFEGIRQVVSQPRDAILAVLTFGNFRPAVIVARRAFT